MRSSRSAGCATPGPSSWPRANRRSRASSRDSLPRDAAHRVRVLRRGGSAGARDGLGTRACPGIASALPVSRGRPGVRRGAERQQSVDALVRVPRVRAGRPAGPVAGGLRAPELPAIRRRIEILDGVREVRDVSKRIALEDDERKPVLEIVPRHYRDIRGLAHILDSNGGYVDHRLFNVDLRFSQRYAIEHDIFPMGLMHYANGVWRAEEEHFALDYPLPALRKSLLDLHVDNPAGIPRMQDRLLGARLDHVAIDGDA